MTNGDREGMISNPAFVGEFTVSQPTEKFTHFIEPIHCPLFLGKTSLVSKVPIKIKRLLWWRPTGAPVPMLKNIA